MAMMDMVRPLDIRRYLQNGKTVQAQAIRRIVRRQHEPFRFICRNKADCTNSFHKFSDAV